MILRTPSRIHITLIDLNGEIGRIDGGVGVALEEPFIEISAEKSERLTVKGEHKERAFEAASKMLSQLKIDGGAEILIKRSYPSHIGLGSGTQLMLGVGTAISKIYGLEIPSREIARIMGRGGTSGIGTEAFEKGGFIIDCGRSIKEKPEFLPSSASDAKPPPIVARYNFPPWKIALVTPRGLEVHGRVEVDIFKRHCPIYKEDVRELSHHILMKTIPSVLEEDIQNFGDSINEIQNMGFKKIEVRLQDKAVRNLLTLCQKYSFGAGLSSFGPTIYCVVEDDDKLREAVEDKSNFILTRANNEGSRLES